jgi:hypothetical protein
MAAVTIGAGALMMTATRAIATPARTAIAHMGLHGGAALFRGDLAVVIGIGLVKRLSAAATKASFVTVPVCWGSACSIMPIRIPMRMPIFIPGPRRLSSGPPAMGPPAMGPPDGGMSMPFPGPRIFMGGFEFLTAQLAIMVGVQHVEMLGAAGFAIGLVQFAVMIGIHGVEHLFGMGLCLGAGHVLHGRGGGRCRALRMGNRYRHEGNGGKPD